MTITLAVYTLGIVLASLAGGWLPLATVLTHRRLQVYLSFAAGSMLGAAMLHMLPEAAELAPPQAYAWATFGLIGMYLLERYFSFHHHEQITDNPEASSSTTHHRHQDDLLHQHHHHHHHPHHAGNHKGPALSWRAAFIGLAVHTLIGGVALASATLAESRSASFGVFLATILHKPADALTLASLMIRSGVPRRTAHLVNIAFALLIPLGAVLFFLGRSTVGSVAEGPFTGAVLAFSAGTFLCIALGDLLPELHFHDHDRFLISGALIAGCALMGLAGFFE
jgi:zinc and cadmium transporter